jgi:hypothetical protein
MEGHNNITYAECDICKQKDKAEPKYCKCMSTRHYESGVCSKCGLPEKPENANKHDGFVSIDSNDVNKAEPQAGGLLSIIESQLDIATESNGVKTYYVNKHGMRALILDFVRAKGEELVKKYYNGTRTYGYPYGIDDLVKALEE